MNVFSRVSLFVSIVCCSSLSVWAQQTVSVNVKADVKPISPLIYGANNPTSLATAVRWGGNRTSAYNWENNYSNAGADYNHISDRYFTIGASNSSTPALPILNMVNTANSRKQYTLVTLQAAGYVARDDNGEVLSSEKAPSNRWDSVAFRKNAEYSLSPNLTDGYVYIDEMIHYLNTNLGSKGNGGIDAFAIDNEPALWGTTHPRIRPIAISHNEVFYKTTELGKVIKELSPSAEVYGPMFYGWWDAKNFAGLGYPLNKGYAWYVDFYLDSLRKVETALNKRILDVVAFHWYPEAKGNVTLKRIVDLGQNNAPTEEELVAPDMVQARLQAPRSLWDESYIEYGNITTSESLQYIKRIQNSINQYYPGTKLAFTEFKYDAEFHFSGGLALADVLGIFGREGVYMASKWDPINDDFGGAAYKLYVNYNNQGGTFGNTSVQASTNDNAVLSTFASTDEQGNLHIIVINKTDSQKSTDFDVSHGYYSQGEVYGFDQSDKAIKQFASISSITNNEFSYTVPAYSALHMVLFAKPQVTIVQAKVTEANASEIILECSNPIQIANAINAISEFSVVNHEQSSFAITSVEVHSVNSIKLTLDNPLNATDSILTVSYSGISVTDNELLPIAEMSVLVHNELLLAPLFVRSAEVLPDGKCVALMFSKQLDSQAEQSSGLSLFVDGVSAQTDSVQLYSNGYGLYIYPTQRIIQNNIVTIENTTGVLQALDSKVASYFNIQAVNNGPNLSVVVDSAVIENNFRIKVYVDKLLEPIDLSNAGFVLYEDGVPVEFSISYNNKILTIVTANPMFNEYAYTLSYSDKGVLQTLYGGYMDSFNGYVLTNNLPSTPDYIAIPSKIEAENYAYHSSSTVFEDCTDVGGGKHLGFVSNGNIFGYHISVAQAANYTLTLRHASQSQKGAVSIWVDGQKIAYLFMPLTASWNTWKNSSVVIPLEAGNHTIEIKVITAGFNLNYLSIDEGENPSIGTLQTAQVHTDGTKLMLVYDRQFAIMPDNQELTVLVDSKQVQVTDITYVGTDSTRLFVLLDTVVYKDAVVSLTYGQTSARTTENGVFESETSKSILNKSTIIPSGLEAISNKGDYLLNPLQTNKVYPLPISEYSFYTIYTLSALPVLNGTGMQPEVIFNQAGVFILEVITDGQKYMQIVVVK